MLITECFLEGESYLYIFYDDVTLDILRFEVKGNTKCKLNLILDETDLKEEISLAVKREQGDKIEVITPTKGWKMIRVVEGKVEKIRIPHHLTIKASWFMDRAYDISKEAL